MRKPFRATATLAVAGALASTLVTAASASSSNEHQQSSGPLVFAHRGTAGYRPEHTSAGYRLAVQMGADYIEPDLVPTKDGVLVDRHEPEISQTTDVADHREFASRETTKVIDGVPTTGWFTTDFTYRELSTLRAKERLPDIRQHNTLYDGRYRVPTLQQDIDQAAKLSKKYHRTVGIIPEIKHSTFFRSVGLPMEHRLLAALRRNGLLGHHPKLPVIIQSFEVGNLKWLHRRTDVPLFQLTSATGAPADFVASGDPRTYADLTTPHGLRSIAPTRAISGRTRTRSCRAPQKALCSRRHRWYVTPIARDCSSRRTPSETRTPSCPPTSGVARTRPTTATPSPSTNCSSGSGWTGSSATTPTPPSPHASSGSPRAARTARQPDRQHRTAAQKGRALAGPPLVCCQVLPDC